MTVRLSVLYSYEMRGYVSACDRASEITIFKTLLDFFFFNLKVQKCNKVLKRLIFNNIRQRWKRYAGDHALQNTGRDSWVQAHSLK